MKSVASLFSALALVVLGTVACSDSASTTSTGGTPSAPSTPSAPAATAMPATPAVPATPTAPMDPAAEALQVFSTRCATCHGPNGAGDGPAAAAFPVKPRNYSDAVWQKSVTDEQIAKTIVEGGGAVGKSPLMAPNPDLATKPEVVKALVAKVRSFGPK